MYSLRSGEFRHGIRWFRGSTPYRGSIEFKAIASKMMTTGGVSKTILIVEDEPSVLSVLAASLKHAGYRVLTADGPQQALELFRAKNGAIDLLLTDVVMPGMNGAELADVVLREHPGIRVLCIAGMPDTPVVRSLVERGYAFLPKPFLPPELTRRVAELLAGPNRAKAAWSA
jgi:two-component system cell cycle sensor histidine kinase/response regulator CckA